MLAHRTNDLGHAATRRRSLAALVMSLAITACTGSIGGYEDGSEEPGIGTGSKGVDPSSAGVSTLEVGQGVGKSGMRRLTIAELDNTFDDLIGDTTRPAKVTLQEEQLGTFNNDYTKLTMSTVLVEGLERLADDVTARLLSDGLRRDRVVGSSPRIPARWMVLACENSSASLDAEPCEGL